MKVYYYEWKNGIKAKENASQQWNQISKSAYRAICEQNKTVELMKRRFFEKIQPTEQGDALYIIECDYERYKESRAEKERIAYRNKIKEAESEQYGLLQTISLDTEYENSSDDTYTLSDMIADENSIFENKVIDSLDLKKALSTLTKEERKLIEALFFDNDEAMSEREISASLHIPQKTFNNRKLKILKKLKKRLAQN